MLLGYQAQVTFRVVLIYLPLGLQGDPGQSPHLRIPGLSVNWGNSEIPKGMHMKPLADPRTGSAEMFNFGCFVGSSSTPC